MKPYGISEKFTHFKSKVDNIKGRCKKLGLKNWWEEAAEQVNKSKQRRRNKIKNYEETIKK